MCSRRWRVLAAIFLLSSVVLTSWSRSALRNDYSLDIALIDLPVPADVQLARGLTVASLREIRAERRDFGSYSALLAMPEGTFVAYSDQGRTLHFTSSPTARFRIEQLAPMPARREQFQDVEAATRDPGDGRIWLAYESINAIQRIAADGTTEAMVLPDEFSHWSDNGGPESMVRLADGSFIILREVAGEGLLFPGDPTEGTPGVSFTFNPPQGYQPTDMALLPDGRALILVRGLAARWPPFKARLLIADPATIRAGEAWQWEPLADLNGPLPRENYEAVAVTEAEDGSWRIWIMSDDNSAVFQRTLLAELRWEPQPARAAKEKGAAAEPGALSD